MVGRKRAPNTRPAPRQRLLRSPAFWGGLGLAALVTLGAVAGGSTLISRAPSAPPAAPAPAALTPVIASSELVVGLNRFALGLLERNQPVIDAQVQLRFFRLDDPTPTVRGEGGATYRGEGLGYQGVYVAHASFDAPGTWGVEIAATRPGRDPQVMRTRFEVLSEGTTPALGAPAPRSRTPTPRDVAHLEEICSARPVDGFHALSIDEAIGQGKPAVILFATPGFCVTRLCGPSLAVLQELAGRHGGRANFVHSEIYQRPDRLYEMPGTDHRHPDGSVHLHPPPGELTQAVREWGLQSEPWLFIVDSQGNVAAKFEGGLTVAEVEESVGRVLDGA